MFQKSFSEKREIVLQNKIDTIKTTNQRERERVQQQRRLKRLNTKLQKLQKKTGKQSVDTINSMDKIGEKIDNNYALIKSVEKLASKISINESDKRAMLFAGFFRTSLSHFYSINILLEKKVPNSAFALIRIYFDSIVRGLYMYHFFEEAELQKIYNGDTLFPKINTMCKKLDKELKISLFHDIRSKAYGVMSDYTHTGANQIARNFYEERGLVQSNFSSDLILDMLDGITSLAKVISLRYFSETGLNSEKNTKVEINTFINNLKMP